MSTCANCPNTASYAYKLGATRRILYCASHLPNFLRTQKYAALLEGTEFFESKRQDAVQKLSIPRTAKTAPKKKRTRKTTPKVTKVEPIEGVAIDTLDVQTETKEGVKE